MLLPPQHSHMPWIIHGYLTDTQCSTKLTGRHLESLSESLHINALCRYALHSSISISCTVLRELIATTFINFLAWLRYNETGRQQCSAAGFPSTSINETASVLQKVNQQQAVCLTLTMLLVHSQSLRWLGINSEWSVVYWHNCWLLSPCAGNKCFCLCLAIKMYLVQHSLLQSKPR